MVQEKGLADAAGERIPGVAEDQDVRDVAWRVEEGPDRQFVVFQADHQGVFSVGALRELECERESPEGEVPAKSTFDIVWLFSVFTHLEPADAESMLRLLRSTVNSNGHLVFSAFVDEALDGFEDRIPEKPLHNAYYGGRLIRELIERNGWSIATEHPADEARFIQHHFVCRPEE